MEKATAVRSREDVHNRHNFLDRWCQKFVASADDVETHNVLIQKSCNSVSLRYPADCGTTVTVDRHTTSWATIFNATIYFLECT
jgi:hypothetical protein